MTDTATTERDYVIAAREFAALVATKNISLETVPVPVREGSIDWDAQAAHAHYTITHARLTRPLTGYYSAGIGVWLPEARKAHKADFFGPGWAREKAAADTERLKRKWKPDLSRIIAALINDAQGADENFDDWCANFGYDTDSRKAETAYRECQKARSAMMRIFGNDFDTACDLVNRM